MQRAQNPAGPPPRAAAWWQLAACTVAVLLILAARVPQYWRTGEFVAEDGWVFFAGAWNHSFLESITLPYAGYLHLLPRLVAELCSVLPVGSQPYAYAWIGLGLNAVVLSAFGLPAFRGIIASDRGRLLLVLLFALAPNAQNLGLILGLHWYLAFGLCLVLLAPAPATTRGQVLLGAAALLGAASSPSGLVLLPFCLVAWWRNGQPADRLKHALLGGALLAVAALVLGLRLLHPERTGAFQWTDLLPALDRLILRGWIGSGLLGPRLAGWLAAKPAGLLDLFAGAVLAGIGTALWLNRRREFARPAAGMLAAALLMLLLSLTRTAYVTETAGLALPIHDRYLTAPTLLLYLGGGILWAHLVPARLTRPAALVLVTLLLTSLPVQKHWSRAAVWFHLRDAVPAVQQLEAQYARDHQPASLYLPADIPYWGPVLTKGGGVVVPPDAGLALAVEARKDPDGRYTSWLGRFRQSGNGPWIEHEAWGRLEFTGLEQGRVFFRDAAGRQLFTSPLLYPRCWLLEDTRWLIISPGTTP